MYVELWARETVALREVVCFREALGVFKGTAQILHIGRGG